MLSPGCWGACSTRKLAIDRQERAGKDRRVLEAARSVRWMQLAETAPRQENTVQLISYTLGMGTVWDKWKQRRGSNGHGAVAQKKTMRWRK